MHPSTTMSMSCLHASPGALSVWLYVSNVVVLDALLKLLEEVQFLKKLQRDPSTGGTVPDTAWGEREDRDLGYCQNFANERIPFLRK